MFFIRIILWPFSLIYGFILTVRNSCYDLTIFKVFKLGIPIVSVGNLSVGGTGKTPHVAFIANHVKSDVKTAVLLRGYGRNTKGFLIVTNNVSVDTVGDEALFYKKSFEDELIVAVCEDRVEGVRKLKKLYPDLGLVILDDAFQHRRIHRDLDIMLMDYNKPFWKDLVMPAGRLREFSFGKKRADVIVVTKAPENIEFETKQKITNKVAVSQHQSLFFSTIKYGAITGFNSELFETADHILLVTGIANPQPLYEHLSKLAEVTHKVYNDHYDFTEEDVNEIHELFDTFATRNKVIVTTQKDFMRLNTPRLRKLTQDQPWFYQEIKVEFNDEKVFKELIEKTYVKNI